MRTSVKKLESPTRENWLQRAFNTLPKGDVKNKLEQICTDCGCSLQSFYRWKASGRVPNKAQRDKICEILNINLKPIPHGKKSSSKKEAA